MKLNTLIDKRMELYGGTKAHEKPSFSNKFLLHTTSYKWVSKIIWIASVLLQTCTILSAKHIHN